MKIKYEFADGTVSEVEVSEEIGSVIVESRRLYCRFKGKGSGRIVSFRLSEKGIPG